MPRKPIRLPSREPRIGPQPASYPQFVPQWMDRRLDAEQADAEGTMWHEPISQCRLCACTHYSPCPEGCGWFEGDLCTACRAKCDDWPLLLLADGYGCAAEWAFAPEPSNESNALA